MRITFVYSTGRTETGIVRMLEGKRRSLVVACSWRQTPTETYLAVRDQLTSEEAVELASALGLDQPPSSA
jgi:hypothetical protein